MKKRNPQSQRKIMPKYLNKGIIFNKNKTNLMNTFRKTKENKIQANQKKNNSNKSHKGSPRTIDYIQIMNKYSHLIEQNSEISSKYNEENNNNKYNNSNYYIKTDYNLDKDKKMRNLLHYNKSYNKQTNYIVKTNKENNKDNYFQFCRTDYENNEKEEDKNNYRFFTLKNFFRNQTSNNSFIKNKPNENENDKNNYILKSSNANIKLKERNFISSNIFNKNNFNKKNYNINIHNTVSLRKISKKSNSSNIHSLNNLDINRKNNFTENKNNSLIQNNISLSSENINKKNKPNKNKNIFNISSEKIKQFVNLCRNYAKFLNNSVNHIESNHKSISYNNNDYFDELKYIINQYNKFIFNEKINYLFNINIVNSNSNEIKVLNKNYISNFNLSEFEPKTLNLTEKFRSKIKDLNTQKSEIKDELNIYKKKNKTLALEKEELDLVNKKLIKENEELNNRIKNIKSLENKCYHQNITIDKLKCQIETLNIDIKYKENIITNLQQILEQIKIKSNFLNYNNKTNDSDSIVKFNSNKNNIQIQNNEKRSLKELKNEYIIKDINNVSDFLLDVNSESIEKDIILPLNLKVNSIENCNTINLEEFDKKKEDSNSEIIINVNQESEEKILQLKKDLDTNNNSNIFNRKSKNNFNEIEESEILSKEMEKIDKDILNLKTKLKKITSK